MGSPYPVVLTTLTGYSDDLLQWYFDQESHENNCNKSQDFADCNSYKNVQYPKANDSLPSDIKTLDNYRQNYLKINKMDGTDHEEVEFFHEKSVQGEEERNLVNKDESRGLAESAIYSIPHHYGSSVRTGMDNELLVNKVGKIIVRDGEKLTNSDFLDLGQGQFTMFELNPAARKLLPNVVVGLEYRMQNSRTPELFLHEDNSFVNLPDQ